LGLSRFMLLEPACEQPDGGDEVIAQGDEQVDVVEVLLAAEAVGQVIARGKTKGSGAFFLDRGREDS
jgi:hypothetical protein